jgi:hypothetical protein
MGVRELADEYDVQDALDDLNAIAALVNDRHYDRTFIDQLHERRFIPLRDYITSQAEALEHAAKVEEAARALDWDSLDLYAAMVAREGRTVCDGVMLGASKEQAQAALDGLRALRNLLPDPKEES